MIEFTADLLIFLGILTILVFFHELGHYSIARLFSVRVDVFSIGFGRELFGWNAKTGTRWKVCWIPLGGYVKMFGFHHAEENDTPLTEEEKKVAFDYKKLWQKSLIVLAGPVANFILAVVFFFFLFAFFGDRQLEPIVGKVSENSIAAQIGVRPGDKITAINSQNVQSYKQVIKQLQASKQNELILTIERNNQTQDLVLPSGQLNEAASFGIKPYAEPKIQTILPDTAAEKAGLESGDLILAIAEQPIFSFDDVHSIVSKNPGETLTFLILRDNKERALQIKIGESIDKQTGKKRGLLGVQPVVPGKFVQLPILNAAVESVIRTKDVIIGTLHALGQMISGTRSTDELGGPIRIFQISSQVADMGLASVIIFMAVISINLGLINLFPIPLLDGGHLLFYGIEAIVRRPLNEKFVMALMNAGLLIIIMLFVFTTVNDVMRVGWVSDLFAWIKNIF